MSSVAVPPEKTLTPERLAQLRRTLPPEAFQPDARKFVAMLLLGAVVLGAHAAVARTGWSWWLPVLALGAAAALSSLAFATHELAHGAILPPGLVRRCAELFFWGLIFISPTLWRRVHNQTHHAHANTLHDPDRPLHAGEDRAGTRWYVWIFYPHAELFPWNPLVFCHFISYILRNTVVAFVPARWRPGIVPQRPDYTRTDLLRIAGELLCIAVLHAGLFLLSGARVGPFLAFAAGTQAATSGVAMTYIFTNHFLNPLADEADPVRGSTSVIVPRWLDRLHWHFSYHTEHHVFPTLNSDYAPLLAAQLEKAFPGEYQRIPLAEAWRRLWRRASFEPRPVQTTS
jgi:fatty acid desaturase